MELLLVLSILSAAIPVATGVAKKKYTLLWLYPLTGLTFDILNSMLRRVWHMNNGITANLFIYFEFLLIIFLFRKTVLKQAWIFYSVVTGLSTFYIADTITDGVFVFNMFGGSVFMLVYIFLSVNCLYLILKSKQLIILEKSSDFWLCTAILIYAAGAFLIFLFKQYMVQTDRHSYMNIWRYFFYPVNIIKNVLLALSIYHMTGKKEH